MAKPKQQTVLVDREHDDQDVDEAARYMRRVTDEDIRQVAASHSGGAVDPALSDLLYMRYGEVARKIKSFDDSVIDAVHAAFIRTARPARESKRGLVFEVPWDLEVAKVWFRRRVDQEWPASSPALTLPSFLATDLPTLLTVSRALDIAALRVSGSFLDDRFPAPPVLVLGPTGTGKELLSRAIHLKSELRDQKFGALNCGGLSSSLLASELFGHVKGAFTGASTDKHAFVATYGTILLDEVGNMPAELQVALLRFLNNGEYKRVGSNKICDAHPRVLSATHIDIEGRVKDGGFRVDLYHRLRGRTLRLRALRDRRASIPSLLDSFFAIAAPQSAPKPTDEVAAALCVYGWPGNLREMKYIVEQMVDASRNGSHVVLEDLPDEVVREYRSLVSAPTREAFAVASLADTGHARSAWELAAEHRLQSRFENFRSKNAASLQRSAQLTRRLATLAGAEAQLNAVADELLAESAVRKAREFADEWLSKGETDYRPEVTRVFERVQEEVDAIRNDAAAEADRLRQAAAQERSSYALAKFVGWLTVRFGENVNAQVKADLDSLLALIESPELDEIRIAIFARLSKLTTEDVGIWKNAIGREFDNIKRELVDVAELGPATANDDEEYDVPAESRLKSDLEALTRAIHELGSAAAVADRVGVTERTVRRWMKQLKKERPKKARGGGDAG